MNATLEIRFRDVYGQTKAYPANEQAQRLADLVGAKTLTPATLRQARAMGFEIVETDRFGQIVGRVAVVA